jgi:hypothetical protein
MAAYAGSANCGCVEVGITVKLEATCLETGAPIVLHYVGLPNDFSASFALISGGHLITQRTQSTILTLIWAF